MRREQPAVTSTKNPLVSRGEFLTWTSPRLVAENLPCPTYPSPPPSHRTGYLCSLHPEQHRVSDAMAGAWRTGSPKWLSRHAHASVHSARDRAASSAVSGRRSDRCRSPVDCFRRPSLKSGMFMAWSCHLIPDTDLAQVWDRLRNRLCVYPCCKD